MGDVIPLPLRGLDFALPALNKIARAGLAANWVLSAPPQSTLALPDITGDSIVRCCPSTKWLRRYEDNADLIRARLEVEDCTVHHLESIVLYLKRRGETIVIEDFFVPGLEGALANIDRFASRIGL